MVSIFIKNQLKGVLVIAALISMGSIKAQLGLTWSEMGPNDAGGRCRSVLVDRNDVSGRTMYAAGVSGGIFKSDSAGSKWYPINNQAASLIVSCMTQDNSGNILFGTGEGFSGHDGMGSSGFLGSGIYQLNVSTSAITQIQNAAQFGDINEIAVDAIGNIYVASTLGFFYSNNGGTTFIEESNSISDNGVATDVKVAKNGDIYYSVYVGTASKVYRAASGSTTYVDKTPTSITNRDRIEIATSPVDANYVYLSISKSNGGLSAVLISDDQAANWTIISLGTSQFDPFIGSGLYANTIVADPVYKDHFYIGSYYLYKWEHITNAPIGQGNWSQIGYPFNVPFAIYIPPFIHCIAFNSGNNSMYIASDGGIYKSVSNNSGFLAYNKGLNISQFYSVAYPIYPRYNMNSNAVVPYAGVLGGTNGNGLTYLPGNLQNGPMSSNSIARQGGVAFQSDFSKLVPTAAFYSGAYGTVYRTQDVNTSPFGDFYNITYKVASVGSPGTNLFANYNTPMRLWENSTSGDTAIYFLNYRDVNYNNNANNKFTFGTLNERKQSATKYDSIIVKSISTKAVPVPTQSIIIIPVYTGTAVTGVNVSGDANISSASNNTVFVNSNLLDSVRYTFTAAPMDSSIITVKFRFRIDAGSTITLKNTDISGGFYDAVTTTSTTIYSNPSATYMPIIKVPLAKSARLAVGIGTKAAFNPSVWVVKRPLNFSINPFWIKIAGKFSRRDGPGGIPSDTLCPVKGNKVTKLEWSPDGQNIYFSTFVDTLSTTSPFYYLYRVSHLNIVGDSASSDFGGIFASDLDSASTYRRKPSQRTTPIGLFPYPITSISVSGDNKKIIVTTGSYYNTLSTVYYSNGDVRLLPKNDMDLSNFSAKQGNLGSEPVYSSLIEMNDDKRVLVGTESGIYSTSDITVASPAWSKESGGNFPNVPVFQIRQQTYPSYKCYNSGIIYAATHGRGIWSTDKYLTNYAIGINENGETLGNTNTVLLFPNPATEKTNIRLQASDNTSYFIKVYDISGRILSIINTQKLMAGESNFEINTSSFNSGVYFVSVEGSNNFKATTKLVITK